MKQAHKNMINKIPQCVALIMDGNRRWARSEGLSTFEGHKMGYEKFRNLLEWAKEAGIRSIVVYALSTENLKRSAEEVSNILDLFRTVVRTELEQMATQGVRIRFAGVTALFPDDLQKLIVDIEEKTANNSEYQLVVCAPYGGRAEIVRAVNKALVSGVSSVSEESFSEMLWTHGVPDPDIIIRSGGEKRLSNFLPWQATYSELFFVDTYWPAFSREDFFKILSDYAERERRMGK